MSEYYLEKAALIRNDPAVHYNCAQAVVMTFEEPCGLSREQALALCAHLGGGAKIGELCGAISGGLIVLGLLGGGEAERKSFMEKMRSGHSNRVRCAELLKEEVHSPAEKKPHCDGMVLEAVAALSEIFPLI